MKKELVISSPEGLESAAKDLLEFCKSEKKFAFYGEIGAGKTTFIKHICNELGVSDTVSSPTYALVNEYQSPDGHVYHIDLYRINDIQEAIDFDLAGYLDDEQYCFVEWPNIAEQLLPDEMVIIHLEITGQHERKITIERPDNE
ncbi:MAG: tRNA (adenosine(37)-N6)-threonylcarbamoyltransferase complex ATPase subunit type 1 TsaE [Bacteroidota bacterium]